jgi:hypothetical protein
LGRCISVGENDAWEPQNERKQCWGLPEDKRLLLLDHLLKGQVREKKQFLMLQMNKKLPGKTIVPDCAVSSHPPNLLNWLGEGKAPRAPRFVCSFQELAAVSCASVPALQDQQGTTLPAC